jgi:hypothetical protein
VSPSAVAVVCSESVSVPELGSDTPNACRAIGLNTP